MITRYARVAAATVPGAVHLRSGRPNQDAVGWLPQVGEGERVVMAVSDGHGSQSSPRSGLGAAMAVQTTTEVLWQLPEPASAESVAAAVQVIVARWNAQVREHLGHNPLTSAELERSGLRTGGDAVVIDLERPSVVYGATLLFAVVSCHELTVGQLGDGDVVVVDDSEQAVRPLPADQRLLAHETTSLSDADPVSNVRTRIMDAGRCRLVLLSTDGYANSFSNDAAFLQVGPDVLRAADAEGIGAIRRSLHGWLAETTRDGAGDDIGVAIALLDPTAPESSADRVPRPAHHIG